MPFDSGRLTGVIHDRAQLGHERRLPSNAPHPLPQCIPAADARFSIMLIAFQSGVNEPKADLAVSIE